MLAQLQYNPTSLGADECQAENRKTRKGKGKEKTVRGQNPDKRKDTGTRNFESPMGLALVVSDGTHGRLARGGLRNRDNRPTTHKVRISYLNAAKRKEAIEELRLIRPRDDILLIGEVSVCDN